MGVSDPQPRRTDGLAEEAVVWLSASTSRSPRPGACFSVRAPACRVAGLRGWAASGQRGAGSAGSAIKTATSVVQTAFAAPHPSRGAITGGICGAEPRGFGANGRASRAERRGSGANGRPSRAEPRGSRADARPSGTEPRGSGAQHRCSGADFRSRGAEYRTCGAEYRSPAARARPPSPPPRRCGPGDIGPAGARRGDGPRAAAFTVRAAPATPGPRGRLRRRRRARMRRARDSSVRAGRGSRGPRHRP